MFEGYHDALLLGLLQDVGLSTDVEDGMETFVEDSMVDLFLGGVSPGIYLDSTVLPLRNSHRPGV